MQQRTKRAANNEKERDISREREKSKVSVGGVKTDCSKKQSEQQARNAMKRSMALVVSEKKAKASVDEVKVKVVECSKKQSEQQARNTMKSGVALVTIEEKSKASVSEVKVKCSKKQSEQQAKKQYNGKHCDISCEREKKQKQV